MFIKVKKSLVDGLSDDKLREQFENWRNVNEVLASLLKISAKNVEMYADGMIDRGLLSTDQEEVQDDEIS